MNRTRHGSYGYALITALIVTAVTAALVLGFVTQVNTEQKIAKNDTDYSQAFYAAEAGLEKLNSDLAKLFLQSVFPSQNNLAAIQATNRRPAITGASYARYELTGGQSARLAAALTAAATTATVDSTTGWPSSGFFMIDSEEITYSGKTATTFTGLARGQTGSNANTHAVNATVFRSNVVTLSEGANAGLNAQTIPFTLDITARAGVGTEARLTRQVQVALIPVFQFGIFSDSDLSFFAGPNFDFGGRVHSNGNIFLAEGNSGTLTLSQKITSAAEIIRKFLANGLATDTDYNGVVRATTSPGNYRNLGLTEGSVVGAPGSTANASWPGLSLSTYNKNILSVATGGKPLKLPFVAEGYSPIELIKRPPNGEATDTLIGQSRLANQASLRVFISDTAAKLPGGAGNVLDNTLADYAAIDDGTSFRPRFAESDASDPDYVNADNTDVTANAPLIGGYVYIDRHNADGTWTDVTMEILNLGISTNQTNAILRFQQPRWDAIDATNSLNTIDYVPINMYDAREARFRDDNSTVGTDLRKLGIMNVVEVDVRKLKDWFAGTIGATGTQAVSNNGYILYYSDRRGNRNAAGDETGELGFEDFVNSGDLEGDPNGALDSGEDLNGNGTLETYGARLPYSPYDPGTDLYTTAWPPLTANVAIDLAKNVASGDTTIEVSSATSVATPGNYKVDNEIVRCTSKSGDVLTCTRAQQGTTAAAHNAVYIDLNEALDTSETGIDVSSDAGITVPGYYRIDSEILYCTAKAANTLTCDRGRLNTTAATHNRITQTVTEDLSNTETGIDVADASSIVVPGFYQIDSEIVKCTSKSSNTLTCSRGAAGTTAANHPRSDLTTNLTASASNTTVSVASGANFLTPGVYWVENEALDCASKSGNNLTCTRGHLGTTIAAHNASDSSVVVRQKMDVLAMNVWKLNVINSRKAASNRVHYFRRALRLVNGTSPNLPTPGFTVASENPLYVMGNYNSNGDTNFADAHSFSAVIADAVTLLSNSWSSGGDDRSFIYPYAVGSRAGSTTFYRMAIASGKGINFEKPSEEDDKDFGTDGGTHNFLRYLEQWSGTSYYRGSIVSLYYYRQAFGPYKCCNTVYGPPTRNYAFDTDFLVPSQLPPGTPRFRDINNLSFRQTIRADSN